MKQISFKEKLATVKKETREVVNSSISSNDQPLNAPRAARWKNWHNWNNFGNRFWRENAEQ